MNRKYVQIFYHLLGCLTLLALPFLFARDPLSIRSVFESPLTRRDLIAYVILIGFFYLNYYLLIPKIYFKRRYALYIGSLVAVLLFLLVVPKLGVNLSPFRGGSPPHGPGPGPKIPIFMLVQNISLFLMILFFSFLLRVNEQWKQVQKEKVNAELAFLKAQINPHFLFNTLNSVYSLAIQGSANTAEAVVKLSGMMRYVLSDADQEWVALDKELAYVRSFVEFQQIRFGEEIGLEFSITGNAAGKKIAPLVLIPFIENAFKYGVNAEENSRIVIRIDIRETNLTVQVANNKVTVREDETWSHGMGVENARKRLELLYRGRYELNISETDDAFTVDLLLLI